MAEFTVRSVEARTWLCIGRAPRVDAAANPNTDVVVSTSSYSAHRPYLRLTRPAEPCNESTEHVTASL